MAQLLAGGIILFGLLVIAFAIFFAVQEQRKSALSVSTAKSKQSPTPSDFEATSVPTPQQPVVPSESEVAATPTLQQPAVPAESEETTVTPALQQPVVPAESEETAAPTLQQPQVEKDEVTEKAVVAPMKRVTPSMQAYADAQSMVWWHEQIASLTTQLQELREHARDVERQIEILSQIATLATELEMLQRKRDISLESKISLFPLHVHRQPTDMSYTTDKRPAVRKYTIEALS